MSGTRLEVGSGWPVSPQLWFNYKSG